MRHAILLIPLLALLAACGGDGEPQTSPTPPPPPSPTRSPAVARPSPTLEATPEPGPRTLVILGGESGHIDAPEGVYVVDADGTNLRRIGDRFYDGRLELATDAQGRTIIDGQPYYIGGLGWSPDGNRVAFYACPSDPASGDAHLYAVNADGTAVTRLSNPPAGRPVVCYSESPSALSWAPDGAKLVYYSYDEPSGLYIVNADGTGARRLVAGHYPRWSPKGDSITFVKQPYAGEGAPWEMPIYAVAPDGSGEHVLANVPRDCTGWALFGCIAPWPQWSPDGTALAFTAVGTPVDLSIPEVPSNEVFVIDVTGGLSMLKNLPKNDPPGGGSYFAGWVNCQLPLPTAGCAVRVIDIGSERLNVRQEPGMGQKAIAQLKEGDTVCMLGSPALLDGLQWWPIRSQAGAEGWAAKSNPNARDKPWLQATGSTCQQPQP